MCFQPRQFFQTTLGHKFCLEDELEYFREDNLDPNQHGRAHDLEIAFIRAKEETFQRLRAEVEQRFGQFDAEK